MIVWAVVGCCCLSRFDLRCFFSSAVLVAALASLLVVAAAAVVMSVAVFVVEGVVESGLHMLLVALSTRKRRLHSKGFLLRLSMQQKEENDDGLQIMNKVGGS